MNTQLNLDEKIKSLEEFLLTGAHLQTRRNIGPFIDLLYSPDEEPRCPDAVRSFGERLAARGWKVDVFQPEPILYAFLRERGKLQDVFQAEQKGEQNERAQLAARQLQQAIVSLGADESPQSILLICRAGGFFPHVGIHQLHERLVNVVKRTTVFFIPATEITPTSFLFLGCEQTLKYRAHYI